MFRITEWCLEVGGGGKIYFFNSYCDTISIFQIKLIVSLLKQFSSHVIFLNYQDNSLSILSRVGNRAHATTFPKPY